MSEGGMLHCRYMTASCHIYERASGPMHQGVDIVPQKRKSVTIHCHPQKKEGWENGNIQ